MPGRIFQSANADRRRFIALYVCMVMGLLASAGLFLYEARIIVADGLRDEDAFAVLGAANRVLHNLENAETGQRGYLLTGDESYLKPYQQAVHDLDDTVLRLHQVVSGDEPSDELVRRVEHAKTDKVTELARTIELARSGNREAAIALVRTNEGKRYMDALRRDLGSLLDAWRQKRKVAVRDAHERLVFGTAALTLVAIFICCMMVYTVVVQRRAFAKVQAWSAALDREATHDALTGLPNRRRLLTAIDALNAQTGPRGRRVGLLYLDIDGFKAVNDELGHSAGDALLRRLAESLRTATRQSDMLARVGGDEFVLLAADCGDDVQLRELAERLISKVRVVGGHEYGGRFPIGVSIGIATWPDRVNTVEDLLDVADSAMYVAKHGGRSTYRFGASPGPDPTNVVRLTR
ncbi:UNVERIFIED_ORG: diguanylate cyclase (GGDEF)-like protein [Burkholderia sp. CF145]|uniref:diguanylate cyclase domain-containing protein n=1 Tax=Paraburkholderia hospita TaxID=169430 RepID=UPI000311848B|nr:diguanylate cyclase [Paraburkholderia hospita]SKC46501.1 diguanylate cyclase (GGDEF) domain-containing protein [Paraburkholderia hospita]